MPVIGSGVFGLGLYIIILAILNFVVDSYQTYAASALAGVSPTTKGILQDEVTDDVGHLGEKSIRSRVPHVCFRHVCEPGRRVGQFDAGLPKPAAHSHTDPLLLQGPGHSTQESVGQGALQQYV